MDIIFPIIGGLIALAIPILVVIGIVYFIMRLRNNSPMRFFSYRSALRAYFYVVILISVIIGALSGGSTLLKVGLGEAFGTEFSYGEVYEEDKWRARDRSDRELELHKSDAPPMTEEEINKQYPPLEERLVYKVKESVIFGASLLLIGIILGLVHLVARRSIETETERVDILRRVYLFAGLLVFAVASIISLTVAIPETLSYMFIGARPGDEYLSPGEPLSIAIISLPVWILYLYLTLRNIKSSKAEF